MRIYTFFMVALLPLLSFARQPNVIIIFTDDQGSVDLNCYGAKDLATPHIAGYSPDGRLRGTEALYRAACPVFDRPPEWNPSRDGAHHTPADTQLLDAVRLAYDIRDDDAALREQLVEHGGAAAPSVADLL